MQGKRELKLLMQAFLYTSEKQYAQVYSYMTPKKAVVNINTKPRRTSSHSQGAATHGRNKSGI